MEDFIDKLREDLIEFRKAILIQENFHRKGLNVIYDKLQSNDISKTEEDALLYDVETLSDNLTTFRDLVDDIDRLKSNMRNVENRFILIKPITLDLFDKIN